MDIIIFKDRIKQYIKRARVDNHGVKLNHPFLPVNRILTPPKGLIPKESSVILLIWEEENEIYLAFTKRGSHLRHHPGQISFPGGKRDPEDSSLIDTAIRELKEETQATIDPTSIIGHLTPCYISVSNFNITPYIAILPERPTLIAATNEVAKIIYIPISKLINASTEQITVNVNETTVSALSYKVDNENIWGATAIIVSELISTL